MNLRYIYIFRYIYIYILLSRSNIINLSVYEFINFRYMNVTLNVYCTRSVMFVGTSLYVFPQNILDQGDIQMRDLKFPHPPQTHCCFWGIIWP